MAMAPQAVSNLIWIDRTLADRALVGGKGASLSKLAMLGAPVPPAFVLTTDAYAEFAESIALPRCPSEVTNDKLPALRDHIIAAPLPAPIAAVLAEGFAAFPAMIGADVALAVRSSAIAEDSAEFSFAGQHDTVLDVRTYSALQSAVKQCWASLWSDRAVAYRLDGNVAPDEVAIAVVVQQLIQSDVSFVAFTSDPLALANEQDGSVVISATWGLGEAIVSGLVNPDHVVVDRHGQVVEYRVGDKHLMIIPGATAQGGTREVPVPRALRSIPALTPSQAASIASLARQLAPRLGFEADFEGALSGDALYLFQARPITTLAPRLSTESVAD